VQAPEDNDILEMSNTFVLFQIIKSRRLVLAPSLGDSMHTVSAVSNSEL
jgi:hypothetical protein